MVTTPQRSSSRTRRNVLLFTILVLFWPLTRFLSHRLPKKPRIVEAAGALQNDTFLAKDSFIVFAENEELWAVSRTCTHLGCRLNFIEEKGYLECPCHQSRFSTDGTVLRGPAEKQLQRYPVEMTGDATYLVTIT
jgi:Rieske Fe-S protein